MPTVAELQILLEARDAATPQLQALSRQVRAVERQVESTSGAFGRMRGLLGGLGGLGLAGMGVGTIVSGFESAIGAVGGLVTSASDLNEQISRTGQIFGEASTQVTEFARTTAQSLGISRTEALEAAGNFGQLFRTSGLAEDAAADMSTSLVRLAGDLASFNNIATGDALQKLRSGLTGEAEPLRELGVLLSEDAVQAKALQLGLAASTKELTEADKVQARYRLIMEQTTRAQGDFQRTSGGLANQMRIIRASFADVSSTLGAALLPTVARLSQAFVQQLPAITAAAQRFADYLAPLLERAFSGDWLGALRQVAADLKPILATWGAAFWQWVRDVTPPLLVELGKLAGAVFAWVAEKAPPFLEKLIGEWVPAFVAWVIKVLPPLLVELGKVIAALTTWATTTGKPELEALGLALGAALVAGFATALEQLGPKLAAAIQNAVTGGRAGGAGGVLRPDLTDPLVRARSGLPPLPLVSPAAQAQAGAGGAPATVVVDVGGVEVSSGVDPQQVAQEAGAAVTQEVLAALARGAAATDPGASSRLQGAGR